MRFAIVLICTVAGVALLHKPLKKAPWLFYLLALALDGLLLANGMFTLPRALRTVATLTMQRASLATALFVVVMYIGVFPKDGAISHALRPVRGELSILACILVIGHMFTYMGSYVPVIAGGTLPKDHVFAAFLVAMALLVLVVILGVTSLYTVKRHMTAKTWRAVQKWAYVFFGLVYLHLMLMLVPSAINGSTGSVVTLTVYSVVFIAYAVARIYRWKADAAQQIAPAAVEGVAE